MVPKPVNWEETRNLVFSHSFDYFTGKAVNIDFLLINYRLIEMFTGISTLFNAHFDVFWGISVHFGAKMVILTILAMFRAFFLIFFQLLLQISTSYQ